MTSTEPVHPPGLEAQALLTVLAERRHFVLVTAAGLTDEQARATPTVSSLSIGGLVKHLTATEDAWARFARDGAAAFASGAGDWAEAFRLTDSETLAGTIAAYQQCASRTEQIVGALPSLDHEHELQAAPWFEPGARWSARRVLAHLIGETAKHAGHADIIRETIDGQRSMG
jgi:uncharacterized damage-inducible protein DinB